MQFNPDGTVDRTAIHEGLIVTAGSKATIGKFLHRTLADSGHSPSPDLDMSSK